MQAKISPDECPHLSIINDSILELYLNLYFEKQKVTKVIIHNDKQLVGNTVTCSHSTIKRMYTLQLVDFW